MQDMLMMLQHLIDALTIHTLTATGAAIFLPLRFAGGGL